MVLLIKGLHFHDLPGLPIQNTRIFFIEENLPYLTRTLQGIANYTLDLKDTLEIFAQATHAAFRLSPLLRNALLTCFARKKTCPIIASSANINVGGTIFQWKDIADYIVYTPESRNTLIACAMLILPPLRAPPIHAKYIQPVRHNGITVGFRVKFAYKSVANFTRRTLPLGVNYYMAHKALQTIGTLSNSPAPQNVQRDLEDVAVRQGSTQSPRSSHKAQSPRSHSPQVAQVAQVARVERNSSKRMYNAVWGKSPSPAPSSSPSSLQQQKSKTLKKQKQRTPNLAALNGFNFNLMPLSFP